MGELDPFGREKGEDTLKEMGWTLPSSEPTPTTFARTADAPAAAQATTPPTSQPLPPVPKPRRSSPVGGLFLRSVIPLAVLGAVGAAVIGAVGTGRSVQTFHIPRITIPKIDIPTVPALTPSPVTPSQPATPGKSPVGLATGSMLRAPAIRAAVAKLRLLGRPYTLRLAADRINAQVVRGTKLTIVQISSSGSYSQIAVAGVGRSLTTFPWAEVDPSAPARLIHATGRRPSSVNYLVVGTFAGNVRLSMYLASGTYYSADAHGRNIQRLG